MDSSQPIFSSLVDTLIKQSSPTQLNNLLNFATGLLKNPSEEMLTNVETLANRTGCREERENRDCPSDVRINPTGRCPFESSCERTCPLSPSSYPPYNMRIFNSGQNNSRLEFIFYTYNNNHPLDFEYDSKRNVLIVRGSVYFDESEGESIIEELFSGSFSREISLRGHRINSDCFSVQSTDQFTILTIPIKQRFVSFLKRETSENGIRAEEAD